MEVSIDGAWGTICNQGFSRIEAAVVCRQLGYNVQRPNVHNSTYFGQGTGPVHMKNLKCLRNHTHIGQCKSNVRQPETKCDTHEKDVGVTCIDGKDKIEYYHQTHIINTLLANTNFDTFYLSQ